MPSLTGPVSANITYITNGPVSYNSVSNGHEFQGTLHTHTPISTASTSKANVMPYLTGHFSANITYSAIEVVSCYVIVHHSHAIVMWLQGTSSTFDPTSTFGTDSTKPSPTGPISADSNGTVSYN